jgi:hypothetical protein
MKIIIDTMRLKHNSTQQKSHGKPIECANDNSLKDRLISLGFKLKNFSDPMLQDKDLSPRLEIKLKSGFLEFCQVLYRNRRAQ